MTRQKFDKGVFFRCGSLEKNDVQTQRTVSPEKKIIIVLARVSNLPLIPSWALEGPVYQSLVAFLKVI